MKVILLIHGHGTAVFDDVQLEAGGQATAYAPSPEDEQQERQMQVQQTAAEALFRADNYPRREGRNVAILGDILPTRDTPTPPGDIAGVLKAHGYLPMQLTADQLANPFILSAGRFDVLVLPDGSAFPAQARQALVDYLAGGGCFLSMGGYAFDDPLVEIDARWFRPDAIPPARPTFSAVVDDFTTPREVKPESSDEHALQVGVIQVPGADGYALHLFTPALSLWATYRLPVDTARLPAGWSQTRLRARADRDDTHLILDRERWLAVAEAADAFDTVEGVRDSRQQP
jgi:hypothetical protein